MRPGDPEEKDLFRTRLVYAFERRKLAECCEGMLSTNSFAEADRSDLDDHQASAAASRQSLIVDGEYSTPCQWFLLTRTAPSKYALVEEAATSSPGQVGSTFNDQFPHGRHEKHRRDFTADYYVKIGRRIWCDRNPYSSAWSQRHGSNSQVASRFVTVMPVTFLFGRLR